jgi:hypothetical protein
MQTTIVANWVDLDGHEKKAVKGQKNPPEAEDY